MRTVYSDLAASVKRLSEKLFFGWFGRWFLLILLIWLVVEPEREFAVGLGGRFFGSFFDHFLRGVFRHTDNAIHWVFANEVSFDAATFDGEIPKEVGAGEVAEP